MQRPLGTLIVPELFITARPRYLVRLELNVTHRRDLLHLSSLTSREKRGVKPFSCNLLVSMKVGRL